MRLLLLTSLALLAAAPAQAVLVPAPVSHAPHGTGNPLAQGARDGAGAGAGLLMAGLGLVPRAVEPGMGLSFGDRAVPSSPADGHLLGGGGWVAVDQTADVSQHNPHDQPLSMAGYSSAMGEPAGWAVVAAAVLTLLGLLGLRRRAR